MSNRAMFYIPRCKELRNKAGLSMNKLAASAKVDSSVISKVERDLGVTENSANKIFYALQNEHPEIDISTEVIDK